MELQVHGGFGGKIQFKKSAWKVSPYIRFGHPSHPLASKTGRVMLHRQRLFDSIGPGWHKCHWCERQVEWRTSGMVGIDTLVVDHLDDNPFNNELANLAPSCSACNSQRAKLGRIQSWEVYATGSRGHRYRIELIECAYCQKAFYSPANHCHVPYRKYCSKSCNAKAVGPVNCAKARKAMGHVIKEGELFIVKADGGRERAIKSTCATCSSEFLLGKTRPRGLGKYCSQSCAARARGLKSEVAIKKGEAFVVSANGEKHRAVEKDCQQCGVKFLVKIAVLSSGRGRFCSQNCGAKARWKSNGFFSGKRTGQNRKPQEAA